MKKMILALCLTTAFSLKAEDQAPVQKEQQEVALEQFDLAGFDFDAQENQDIEALLKEDSKPLSAVEVYARQIGVALLFKYLDAKEYCGSWVRYLNQLIRGNFKIEWM